MKRIIFALLITSIPLTASDPVTATLVSETSTPPLPLTPSNPPAPTPNPRTDIETLSTSLKDLADQTKKIEATIEKDETDLATPSIQILNSTKSAVIITGIQKNNASITLAKIPGQSMQSIQITTDIVSFNARIESQGYSILESPIPFNTASLSKTFIIWEESVNRRSLYHFDNIAPSSTQRTLSAYNLTEDIQKISILFSTNNLTFLVNPQEMITITIPENYADANNFTVRPPKNEKSSRENRYPGTKSNLPDPGSSATFIIYQGNQPITPLVIKLNDIT